MTTLREQMEQWSERDLFNHTAAADLNSEAGRAVRGELERRREHRRREVEAAQIAAANAQVDAAKDGQANLSAVRKSVFWTAVAAVATAVSAAISAVALIKGWR